MALVIFVGLAGCATPAPRPAAGVAAEIPVAWSAPVTDGRAEPVPAAWWRQFSDPVLVQLVEAARAANPDLAIAAANLRRARSQRDLAAAGARPTLQASVSAQRQQPARSGVGSLFDAGFDAAWEADLFGATAHGTAAAEADAQASAATLAAAQLSVAGEVALNLVQLRGAQVRAQVARDSLAAQEETLQIAQWRAQAGLASALEVAQARSSVEQTRASLPALEASQAQSRHALAVLSGQAPAALDALLAPPAALPQPPRDWALAIPAATLRARPDLQAAEQQLVAAAERVAQADAARRPVLTLRASLGWSAATLGGLGSAAAAGTLLGALAQPLVDGGARAAQLGAQQAAFDAVREQYRAKVLAALQEVEDALAALAGAEGRVGALERAAEAAGDAALLARHRYASGIVDFQIVLDTQRSLLAVQDNLASARTAWVTEHVRLFKAVGGAPAAGDARGGSQ